MKMEVFDRYESKEISKMNGWILIYGRRKVGKTFLIKNFLNYDVYFRINRDGKISAEKFDLKEINNLSDFLRILRELLEQNKRIVIDEFQRLPEFALEEISTANPRGKIIFCGSSMRIIKKILDSRSPLLGLTVQYRLGLIRPKNVLEEFLKRKMEMDHAIELAPYFSDAWAIPFFRNEKSSLVEIYNLLSYSKLTVPALVGEIFTEEERELTKTYEAILRLMGAGEWNYREIANKLFNRGLIEKADSSLVLPHIKNLVAMGLVETLPLYSSKKKMYKLSSSVMESFYYLSDRYNFEEVDVSLSEVRPTLEKLRNLAVQNWIADFFAEVYGGRKEYFVTGEKEIDFIISVRNKAVVVGEVKWGKYSEKEIEKFRENTKFIDAKKVFVVKNKVADIDGGGVEIIGVKELMNLKRVGL